MSLSEKYGALAERAVRALRFRESGGGLDGALMIGIAGVPGAGKSTLAREVCRLVNEADPNICALVLPMDGFHLSRKQLDSFDDPIHAHCRRGSPETFDADAFVTCMAKVRLDGCGFCPSFDHGIGDPVEDAIPITKANRIIFVEGLYLYLEKAPWNLAPGMLDECWYVRTSVDIAMARVKARHLLLGGTEKYAKERITTNDQLNAEIVWKDAENDIVRHAQSDPVIPGDGRMPTRVIDLVIEADEHVARLANGS